MVSWTLRSLRRLVVEPDVFHTPAVVNAVDHRGKSLNPRLPAGCGTGMMDDRSCPVAKQFLLDLPYQLPTPFIVCLHRLLLEKLLDFMVAVSRIVELSTATIILIQ